MPCLGAQDGVYNAGPSLAQAFFDQIYGTAGVDYGALTANYVSLASGMVNGGNPPYSLQSFLAVYPKFFGAASSFKGDTVAPPSTRASVTQGSNVIVVNSAAGLVVDQAVTGIGIAPGTVVTGVTGTNVTLSTEGLVNTSSVLTFTLPANYIITNSTASTTGLAVGQLISGPGIAGNTLITAFDDTTVTLSLPLMSTATQASFNFYASPWVPLLVIQLFINMAQGSIMQARWLDMWCLAMPLYIAHYVTLWMRTETGPNTTAAAIVASGVNVGIITSKSVGDVSAGLSLVAGFLADWGSYNQTEYGIQFATFAAAIGGGPIYVGSAPVARGLGNGY